MTTFFTPLNRNLWTKDLDGIPTIEKEEDSVQEYPIDFTNELYTNERILTATYDASGVTVDSFTLATPVCTPKVSGTNGNIKLTVTTADTRVQTFTVVIDTATNDQEYSLVVNGTTYSYTADSSATKAEITAGLKAAIDAGSEPVTVTDDETDTLTIVSDQTVRAEFTLTEGAGAADMTTTETVDYPTDEVDMRTLVKRIRFRSPNTGRRTNDYDYSS